MPSVGKQMNKEKRFIETRDKLLHLIKDTFIIDDGDFFLLYAPLAGKLIRINQAALNCIKDIIVGGGTVSERDQSPFVYQLVDLGILSASPPDTPSEEDIAVRNMNIAADGSFAPIQVTLSITTKCPLRCIYCFASAGEGLDGRHMSIECGMAAIDSVYESITTRNNRDEASILFFGEAEPTAEWQLLTQLVAHAKNRSSQTGIRANLGITTNGFISESKGRFLADHFRSITLSFDGPEWAQNCQRPTSNSSPSFKRVFET